MTDAHDSLTVSTRHEGDGAVVELDGELDLHTSPMLTSAIGQLVEVGATRVTVDAAGLTFADSSGLRSLVAGRERVTEAGGSLVLAAASPALDRLLEMTGLRDILAPLA